MRLAAHDIREPRLRQVFAYWDSKRHGRAMLSRADLDPVEIPRLLAYLYLVDIAPDIAQSRFRLYGTAVAEFFGRDNTGQRLADVDADDVDRLLDDHGRAAAGAAVYMHGAVFTRDHSDATYHRLLLPLARDGRTADMLLCAVDFDDPISGILPHTLRAV